jgi:HlyD family secretion protein
MSFSSDVPHIEASGNVVRFPGAPNAARNGWRKIWRQAWEKSRSGLKNHGFTAAVVVLAGAGISAGWWSFSAASIPRYTTMPVTRGTVARSVIATGTVNPARTIVVGASISGTIQNLACDYDDEVKAGQVCAKIDARPYQARLDQYSGQLLRDRAILEKDRADLARLRRHAVGNPFAQQQVRDQTLVANRDEGTVKLDQALVDSAKLDLGYTDIVAPVDGTVMSRNIDPGQPVAANSPALFLIAPDPKHMAVDATTSQTDIGAVRQGDEVTITIEALPDRVFQGTVSQVRRAPQSAPSAATGVETGAATYDAVVNIDNADLALKPGMTATTQIIVAQKNDVLRVPDQALRFAPSIARVQSMAQSAVPAKGQSQIWLLRGNEPVAVNVVIGLDDGNLTEIAQGELRPGDQVIVGENRPQTNNPQGSQSGAP